MSKNILIIGASSGIGKIIGEYLTQKGHSVIGTSRVPHQQSSNFELIKLDVTNPKSIKVALNIALNKFKVIDVLINSAGYGLFGSIEETSIEESKELFETNYFGLVQVTKQLLPHLRNNKKGLIINISSMAGLIGMPFQGHYSASKFAVEGFMEALRLELIPFGIKVCNICPADFKTAFTSNRKQSQKRNKSYKKKFAHFLKLYKKEEEQGADPILVAKLVDKILYDKKIQPRYITGNLTQTIGIPIKRFLGASLFEKIMIKIWNAK